MSSLIGREDTGETRSFPMREELRWIGKPWRRIELLTHRHFYRGEQSEVQRNLNIHIGSRRLGVGVTLILSQQPGMDYSEDRL